MSDTVFPYDDEVKNPYDGEVKNPHEETAPAAPEDDGDDEDEAPKKRGPGRPRKNST